MIVLHRTWKHNRPDVLWKNGYTKFYLCLQIKQLQNMENITCSLSKQAIYFTVWYKNMIQKQYAGNISVRRPDKTATSTATPKGKYTESLTFSTPNCIYANYGKLGKPSLQLALLWFCVLWRTMHAIILPCLVQHNWPNFVSEHLMFFPMFCHQTFVNAHSCPQWIIIYASADLVNGPCTCYVSISTICVLNMGGNQSIPKITPQDRAILEYVSLMAVIIHELMTYLKPQTSTG